MFSYLSCSCQHQRFLMGIEKSAKYLSILRLIIFVLFSNIKRMHFVRFSNTKVLYSVRFSKGFRRNFVRFSKI